MENAPSPLPSGRLLFISPHLDDGVFSCGRLLASAADKVVLTVFAGFPTKAAILTDWDRSCGFRSGQEALTRRRQEDRAALAVLDARPVWLEFLDSQYCPEHRRPGAEEIAGALARAIDEWAPRAVYFPLGLFHSDHQLAHAAALRARQGVADLEWIAYADALYRDLPGLQDERLGQLGERGIVTSPVRFAEAPGACARKAVAAACYASQLRGLATPGRPGGDDLARPERYWRLRA